MLLLALVPALRAAAASHGPLTTAELRDFEGRDFARGRRCLEPAHGVAAGITSRGALIIEGEHGVEQHRAGSLEFATGTEAP